MPRDSRRAAREAAAIPFPNEETTPPDTNTYLVIEKPEPGWRMIAEFACTLNAFAVFSHAHRRGLDRFVANLVGQARLVGRELGRGLDRVVPRMRQINAYVTLHAPGSRGHHGNAVRHEDRLIDVVRHEQHGLAVR